MFIFHQKLIFHSKNKTTQPKKTMLKNTFFRWKIHNSFRPDHPSPSAIYKTTPRRATPSSQRDTRVFPLRAHVSRVSTTRLWLASIDSNSALASLALYAPRSPTATTPPKRGCAPYDPPPTPRRGLRLGPRGIFSVARSRSQRVTSPVYQYWALRVRFYDEWGGIK